MFINGGDGVPQLEKIFSWGLGGDNQFLVVQGPLNLGASPCGNYTWGAFAEPLVPKISS